MTKLQNGRRYFSMNFKLSISVCYNVRKIKEDGETCIQINCFSIPKLRVCRKIACLGSQKNVKYING